MYRLLILDDEILFRRYAGTVLDWQELGFELYEASNGAAGLEIVKKFDIDLVLADINMPVMDGIEFGKKARKIKENINIVIVSGYGEFEFAKKAIQIGVSDYILKPFTEDEIKAVVLKIRDMMDDKNGIVRSESIGKEGLLAQRVKAYADENFKRSDLTVGEIAKYCCVDASYIRRAFKKTYNNGYKYCVKFDMASFFDLIDHETLSQIMLNNGIDEDIVMILKRCLGKWAQTTIMFDENYNKTHGLPQGPLCSSFFAELYLFPLDALMRRQSGVKYFRYVDDINLMVQSVERGNKLKLFLELAIRDLGLIPQNTKVNVQKIENIDKHMQQKFNNFSVITRHFKSNGRLNEGEHNRLKNKIKRCIEAKEIDKTLINFSLYKLNKDDEIKKMLLDNKELFTSYFQPVISYLNRCFPSDDKVIDFIIRYISSEEELFQYNKAILVGKYGTLPFNEKILEQCDHDKSWILKYRMFQWLYRNEKKEILNGYHVNDKDNYFMQQILLWVKIKSMQDSVAKKQLLRKYIFNCKNNNDAYMLSIQGYFLWNEEFQYEPFDLHSCDGGNRYIRRYVTRRDTDYFRAKMKEIYDIDIPQDFIEKVKEKSGYYEELERAFKGFIMLKKLTQVVLFKI